MLAVNIRALRHTPRLHPIVAATVGTAGMIVVAAHPALSDRTIVYNVSLGVVTALWFGVLLFVRNHTRLDLPPSGVRWMTAALLGSGILSIALNPLAGWQPLWRLGANLTLLWMGYWLAADRRSLHFLAGMLGAAAVFSGLYALIQFVALDPLPAATPFAAHRVVATFSNPNHLGNFQACVLPLGLAAMLQASWTEPARRRRMRGGILLTVILIVYSGLLLSASRGAWMAALAGTAIVMGGHGLAVHRGQTRWPLRWLAAMAVALLLVTWVIARYPLVRAPQHSIYLAERLVSTQHVIPSRLPEVPIPGMEHQPDARVLSSPDGAINHRYFIWRIAWDMVGARPLYGIGYGAFQRQFGTYRDAYAGKALYRSLNPVAQQEDTAYAHNEYLHVWAECGFLGLASLLLLLLTGLSAGLLAAWKSTRSCPMLWGLLGLATVVLVHGLVSYPLQMTLNGMVAFIAFGILLGIGRTLLPDSIAPHSESPSVSI